MAENEADLDAGFVRQRRNLILVSLGLLAALHYGLTFEKINILGNETKLPGSQPVSGLVGWFWLYFLWRYVTALLEVRKRMIAVTYNVFRLAALQRYAKSWWRRNTEHGRDSESEFIHAGPAQSHGRVSGGWNQAAISYYVVKVTGSNRVRSQRDVTWDLPLHLRAAVHLEAVVLLTVRTSKVSEYIGPFVVAAAPAVYWAWLHV